MKVRTIFLVRHRLWQSPTLHPPSPSRPFLVFWTTCQEREALNVRGIRHHSWLSLLYRVFLPLGLCFTTIPQITVFTPWLFPPHYLYLLFIFFTIVFVTICNCYYFYGLLFVFFTIVFVIICICYYLYLLLFVLVTICIVHLPADFFLPTSFKFASLLSSIWWIAPETWKAKTFATDSWLVPDLVVGGGHPFWCFFTWLASRRAPSWLLSNPRTVGNPIVPSARGRLIPFSEVHLLILILLLT